MPMIRISVTYFHLFNLSRIVTYNVITYCWWFWVSFFEGSLISCNVTLVAIFGSCYIFMQPFFLPCIWKYTSVYPTPMIIEGTQCSIYVLSFYESLQILLHLLVRNFVPFIMLTLMINMSSAVYSIQWWLGCVFEFASSMTFEVFN